MIQSVRFNENAHSHCTAFSYHRTVLCIALDSSLILQFDDLKFLNLIEPGDLTAMGVTDPAQRDLIVAEAKKLSS